MLRLPRIDLLIIIATAFHHVSSPLPTTQNLKGENLRGGKVLTGECQMWRGPPSSIAGKAANNHLFECVDISYLLQPKMEWIAHVRARETFHIKHQFYSIEMKE
jgi:hypothetical protein